MKLNIAKLAVGVCLTYASASAAIAEQITEFRDGYVTRSQAVWATRIVSEPISTTTCRNANKSQNISLGDLVVGGLIGSAIGNKLSDNHGAGTLGAVAGAWTASTNKQRHKCVRETTYTNHTEKYPSHYVIHVRTGAQRLKFDSSRPYQINERVRVRVSSEFSVLR